jgi:hypothetical protein
LIKDFHIPWCSPSGLDEVLSLIYKNPCFNLSIMSLEMESMSNLPCRICWETLLNSKGPRISATGPLAKGVWDAWEKCASPFFIRASNIAWHLMIAVQVAFSIIMGLSGVQSSSIDPTNAKGAEKCLNHVLTSRLLWAHWLPMCSVPWLVLWP